MLNARCVTYHNSRGTNEVAAKIDLSPAKAYDTLITYGKPNLRDQVWAGYRRGFSIPGEGIAEQSALLRLLDSEQGHNGVSLDADSRERLLTWMDTYAQRVGHFSEAQERELIELRRACARLLTSPSPGQTTALRSLSDTPP